MKIYTYYNKINKPHLMQQEELIKLWKLSWERKGFEPIVLGKEHAQAHPYYEEFCSNIRSICKKITGKDISDYGMSCLLRWMAYATQKDEKFYVSDYDIINNNFEIIEPIDNLHLMDWDVPCLASGTPIQFDKFCRSFVDISLDRIDVMNINHYHDQEFVTNNLMPKHNSDAFTLRDKYNITISIDRFELLANLYDPEDDTHVKKYKIFHLSHNCITQIKENNIKYKDVNCNQLRINMAKKILNI